MSFDRAPGGHIVETTRARAWADAIRTYAGLSWGNPATREELARRLAPHDTLDRALQMAGAQSNCALVCAGALYEAGVDGLVRALNTRGGRTCDPLREPRWGHYDGVSYLETLALQRSARCRPDGQRPAILPGSWVLIGGSAEAGGTAHMVCVVDVRPDGTLDTVEGGKSDPGNPHSGAENCTAVAADHRELYQQAESWWLRDAGSTGRGRRVGYWCWVGDLPLVAT